MIQRLDSPRKQVFVEAMILEVTLDKQRDLGVSFHGAKPFDIPGLDNQSLAVGGLNPAKTLFPAGALTETMLAGVLGPVLSPEEARNLGRRVDRHPRHPVIRRADQGAADATATSTCCRTRTS